MAKFEIPTFDLPTFEIPTEAARPLYAAAGATDVVVGYVRDAVADVQKQLADVQTRIGSLDFEPAALREVIEARVAELQGFVAENADDRERGVRRPRQARRDPGRPDPHPGVDEGDRHGREDHDRQGEDHQDAGHQGCEEDHDDRQEVDEVDGQEGHLDREEDLDRSEEQREGDHHRGQEDRLGRRRRDDRRRRQGRRLNSRTTQGGDPGGSPPCGRLRSALTLERPS